jgi:hypothetical protein
VIIVAAALFALSAICSNREGDQAEESSRKSCDGLVSAILMLVAFVIGIIDLIVKALTPR